MCSVERPEREYSSSVSTDSPRSARPALKVAGGFSAHNSSVACRSSGVPALVWGSVMKMDSRVAGKSRARGGEISFGARAQALPLCYITCFLAAPFRDPPV